MLGAVDLRAMGKLFLRQASGLPIFAQIGGQNFPDLHGPEKPPGVFSTNVAVGFRL